LMSDDEELAAVERCLSGESRAFETIVDSYQRVLFNVALRMVNDRDDAQDVVQAAFLKAYEKLRTYDRRRKLFSWIYRIVVNECLDQLARRKRQGPVDGDEPGRGPDDTLEEREVEAVIGAALLDLSVDYRGVIILRHFVHLSHREMSRVLEIPEKTVKSRLHSARKLLGELLVKRGVSRA
jgi:RNA polymerase sigma-70 factor, ECF subfamily